MMITIQDVITKLLEPVERIDPTVDKLISGNPHTEVKGIVTAFMATQHVIEQAQALDANLIISHEGAFFSHHDEKGDLHSNDPVYQEKRRLIAESDIAIFRFHDYWHQYKPDGIMAGLITSLNWQAYVDENQPVATILTIPTMSVRELAEELKNKLQIPTVRVVGGLSMACSRVGLLVGYRGGGATAIPLFENEQLDVIITGEGPEWETPEYVRDAVHQGRNKALIALGHAESEQPGMAFLADKLSATFPTLPIHYIAEKPVFQFI